MLEHDEENQETYFEPEDIVDNDEMWRTSDDDVMPSDIEVHVATRALAQILDGSLRLIMLVSLPQRP